MIFDIAGGNKTAIQVANSWMGEQADRMAGQSLMLEFSDVEQSGVYYRDTNRLEMAGGEFCGNATAATAVMVRKLQSVFGVSGLRNVVSAVVEQISKSAFKVTADFGDMNYTVAKIRINDKNIRMIRFDGIVHLVVDGEMPGDYMLCAKKLREAVQLGVQSAVGVIWVKRTSDGTARINPVVWVESIDTSFYESSCGSGSVAAAVALGLKNIIQPTGKVIRVDWCSGRMIVDSEVRLLQKENTPLS